MFPDTTFFKGLFFSLLLTEQNKIDIVSLLWLQSRNNVVVQYREMPICRIPIFCAVSVKNHFSWRPKPYSVDEFLHVHMLGHQQWEFVPLFYGHGAEGLQEEHIHLFHVCAVAVMQVCQPGQDLYQNALWEIRRQVTLSAGALRESNMHKMDVWAHSDVFFFFVFTVYS